MTLRKIAQPISVTKREFYTVTIFEDRGMYEAILTETHKNGLQIRAKGTLADEAYGKVIRQYQSQDRARKVGYGA